MPILFVSLEAGPACDGSERDAMPGAVIEIDANAALTLQGLFGGGRGQLRGEHLNAIRSAAALTERSSDLRLVAQFIQRFGSVDARLL